MLFSGVWSENAALFERLMEIHSNPPILYFSFNSAIVAPLSQISSWQCGIYCLSPPPPPKKKKK